MVLSDDFMDALAVLDQQAKQIATVEGEILNEFLGISETVALVDSTPTSTTRAPQATQYIWTTVAGPTQIIWGEWQWKT